MYNEEYENKLKKWYKTYTKKTFKQDYEYAKETLEKKEYYTKEEKKMLEDCMITLSKFIKSPMKPSYEEWRKYINIGLNEFDNIED